MQSWRDSASGQAQDDLDELLNIGLPFAHQCLEKYGEFVPFSAAIGLDGKPVYMMVAPGGDELPDSQQAIGDSYAGLRDQRADIRAAMVVSDVSLKNLETDAVHYAIEHAEGISLGIVEPYTLGKKGLFGKKPPTFGQMSVSVGESIVWA